MSLDVPYTWHIPHAPREAFADANMNVLKTAKALEIHPNTIYARLQKIHDITGKNALSYHALTELLLAAECANPAG